MKRVIGMLLCAALVLSFAAGCNGQQETPEQTQAPTQPTVQEIPYVPEQNARLYEDVQLQYWTLTQENSAEAEVIRQAANYFQEITGAQMEITWLAGDEARLEETLTGDIYVDIFDVPGKTLEGTCQAYAADLTQMAQAADYDTKSYEVLRAQVVDRCGALKAIPWLPRVYGMLYNRDVFEHCGIEADPASWEAFLNVCRTLAQKGYEPLTMDLEKTHVVLELHLERAIGAERIAQLVAGGGWENDEQVVQAVQNIVDFVEEGLLASRTPEVFPAGQNKIALSNAAMVAGSSETCSEVEEAAKRDMHWGIFPYPGDGVGTGSFVDSTVLVIHKDSAAAQAAFDFAMLLASGEFDQLRADLTGGIPADPANESRILGARELLLGAKPQALGQIDPVHSDVYAKVWQGYYKLSRYYASTLNIIKPAQEREP